MALSLSSVPAVAAHIASARSVAFGAYLLPPGSVRDALVRAARRGARVDVTLQRDPYRNDDGARMNARAAHTLRAAGAHVALPASAREPFHLKAAVCDGVAYLDDRNWTASGSETVIADDAPHDVALVRSAIVDRRPGADATLALSKAEALRRECALVSRAADDTPVVVESEYVRGSPLVAALRSRAQRGAPTTLIVPPARDDLRDALLARLRGDGIDVREGGRNEKLALAGDSAWIGSGNATGASGRGARQLEWGLVTRNRALVAAVRDALARDAAVRPVRARPESASAGRPPGLRRS